MPPLHPDHVLVADLLVAGGHDAARLVLEPPAGAVRLLALVVTAMVVWLATQVVPCLAASEVW